jgi:hypothetical protein
MLIAMLVCRLGRTGCRFYTFSREGVDESPQTAEVRQEAGRRRIERRKGPGSISPPRDQGRVPRPAPIGEVRCRFRSVSAVVDLAIAGGIGGSRCWASAPAHPKAHCPRSGSGPPHCTLNSSSLRDDSSVRGSSPMVYRSSKTAHRPADDCLWYLGPPCVIRSRSESTPPACA